jgi:hypothetical protein
MKPTLNEKFLAYLALFSGISLSIVAEYYSILGLMAIFSAAPISVVVMGIALGVGKITATLWLKQNWKIAPWSIRAYLLSAIGVLMLITSMGIFGFLSKAHSDQSLVSGDVISKIAVYDEKIKTAKDNIDANRKALKQMDEAVDQVMARSSSETGADKAVGIRRAQQKERARLQSEIAAEQKIISQLSEERAPIAAEVRKVEAEVGPIKYIAQFVYGEANESLLEKAVTWVIIILIVVFDPLAVILLLSSQISFQRFREQLAEGDSPEKESDVVSTATVTAQPVADLLPETVTQVSEETVPVAVEEVNALLFEATQELEEKRQAEFADQLSREQALEVAKTYIPEKSILEQHPYLTQPFSHFKNLKPIVHKAEGDSLTTESEVDVIDNTTVTNMERPGDYLRPPQDITEDVIQQEISQTQNREYIFINGQAYHRNAVPAGYVQNEEQRDSGLWSKTIYSEKK